MWWWMIPPTQACILLDGHNHGNGVFRHMKGARLARYYNARACKHIPFVSSTPWNFSCSFFDTEVSVTSSISDFLTFTISMIVSLDAEWRRRSHVSKRGKCQVSNLAYSLAHPSSPLRAEVNGGGRKTARRESWWKIRDVMLFFFQFDCSCSTLKKGKTGTSTLEIKSHPCWLLSYIRTRSAEAGALMREVCPCC